MAAGHAETCRAATAALEAGGNAFDAAVAAGFASAVCEPALTSLGGGGFLLARPAEGRPVLFDFFADTPGRALPPGDLEPHFLPVTVRFPASEQVFNVGLGSCAVPAALRGYLHVHGRLGRLPLREVLAPAVALAREGVRLNARQAYFLSLLRPILTLTGEVGRSSRPGAPFRSKESGCATPPWRTSSRRSRPTATAPCTRAPSRRTSTGTCARAAVC